MVHQLCWAVLKHLPDMHPRFAGSRKGKGLLRRFKRTIHAVDSTTIQWVASCWLPRVWTGPSIAAVRPRPNATCV